MQSAIHCENLTRDFGSIRALDNLTLSVPEGSIFAFLGPNGAGKTTTIHLLLGLIEPTSGSSRILGLDPATDGAEVRRHAGALLEHSGLYERLSAENNLRFYASIAHLTKDETESRIEQLLVRFGLFERRTDVVATWSRGMKQKLAIARVLLHRPSIVFLDEPTAGLDPEAMVALRRDIVALGTTVFLTTHNLTDVEKMATHVAVIQSGRLLDAGTPDELRRRAFRSRAFIRTSDSEQTIDLGPGESIAPIVTRLVHEGAQIEEVRREEPSIEDVFLRLVRDGSDRTPDVATAPPCEPPPRHNPRPIFSDIAAVMRKEWREVTSPEATGFSKRSTYIAVAILVITMAAIAATIGPTFVESPIALGIGCISTVVLLGSVADSFAGERERHTLETVLASAIPDLALLLGKIVTNVVYAWATTLFIMIAMLIGANANARGVPMRMYPPSTLVGTLVLIPLMMLMISTVGVLLSLRAPTVREAQARLGIALVVAVVAISPLRFLMPDAWKTNAAHLLLSESGRFQAIAVNVVMLLVIDVVLVAFAMMRFKRSTLITLR